MVDKDLLFAKINNIQNCLQRIEKTSHLPHRDLLQNMDIQDIVVLNLQRAVQSVIDMAAHVVASENLGIPSSQKEFFLILEKNKIITHSLSQAMQKMVGFRNIAVHDYSTIDPHILISILETHLGELENFYSSIISHFNVIEQG